MKLGRKLAALMVVMMLATSLPTFAASTNGVNKIITVAKDTSLDGKMAPQLKIELKDDLTSGQAFYLHLENADWDKDIAKILNSDSGAKFKYALSGNEKELQVKAKGTLKASSTIYTIPMLTTVTGGDAAVIIDANDTVVTGGKYVYATSNNKEASVTSGEIKSFATAGKMAEITIEEAHIGAFKNDDKNKTQKVRFELVGSGFEFDYDKAHILKDKLVGTKAYTGKTFNVEVIDKTTLEATIKANELTASQRGALTLTDVQVRATSDASYGDVDVLVSGDLNKSTQVLVAKYGDYDTGLTVAKDYTVTAGQKLQDVEFTLSETVANSLNGNRETTFTFPEGVTIDTLAVKETKNLKKNAKIQPVLVKDEGKNTNRFNVETIATDTSKKASLTFKATLNIPASFNKDINLVVAGRSLEEKKEVKIAKVEASATVAITPVTLKVGLAKQTGGKVIIQETSQGKLAPGKIFLAIDDKDFGYTKAPEVKVTQGNLKVDEKAKIVKGGLEITVNSKSTIASTLEINGGDLKVSGYVAEGTYAVKVGGSSLSLFSAEALWDSKKADYNDIDEIVKADFIQIGTKNMVNKAVFVIGQSTYTVNGKEKTMDTASYLAKEGRTMLPVRYVADALGVGAQDILWDGATKTVTILADRVVQIKLGRKEMVINGALVPMTAPAEIKNNRVFIPVAEVARALSANVEWDETSKTATFN